MNEAPRDNVMVMTALLTAKPEKKDELSQTLLTLVWKIRNLPSCLEAMAGQDLGNGPQFLLYIVWKDLASLEAYMASEEFRVLLGASSVLAGPTAFRFTCANGAFPSPEAPVKGRGVVLAKVSGGLPSGP